MACTVLMAQELKFDTFVPSDVLHHYYSFGAPHLLQFRGRPLANGARIIVFGALQGRSFDSKGAYVEMAGSLNGVVHVYMALPEFDKLRNNSYVNESLLRRGTKEIGVEATLVGLNKYGTLDMHDGTLLPWASVLLDSGAAEQKKSPSTPRQSQLSRPQQPVQAAGLPSDFFRYPAIRIRTTAKSIRDIDFANYAYPWILLNSKAVSTTIRLRSGESAGLQNMQQQLKLADVTFGDVTGDGIDEAIVTLSVRSDGLIPDRSWMRSSFVYTLRSGFVALLAVFDSGFNLRRMAPVNGQLVIESDEIGDRGMCCPVAIVESHYKWVSGRFVLSDTKRTQLH